MKQYICNIILVAIITGTFHLDAYSQNNTTADSLIYYLKKIKSSTDTVNINMSLEWIFKNSEKSLVIEDIFSELKSVRNKVEEKDYYNMINYYFNRIVYINTPELNEKAIGMGKEIIAQFKKTGSKYPYYSLIAILRNLRLPFRNSGKINEMLAYYSSLDKKYQNENDSACLSIVYNVLSGTYFRLGILEKGRYYQLKSIAYLNDSQQDYSFGPLIGILGKAGKINGYAVLGSYYVAENQPFEAEKYFNEAVRIYQQIDSPLLLTDIPFLFLQIARSKTLEGNVNSSKYYDTTLKYFNLYDCTPIEYAHFYQEKAADFASKNQLDSAIFFINKSRAIKDSFHFTLSSFMGELQPDYYSALISIKQNHIKEAIGYLQTDIKELRPFNFRPLIIRDLVLLARIYSSDGNSSEAYKTLNEAFTMKEKMLSDQNEARSLNFETEKKMQEGENKIMLLDAQNKNNKKIKYYLIGIVSLLGLLAIALGFFYSNKRNTSRRLALKNEKLALTLVELKSTQSQLIQSEKMACLGELTAGIAHEIQNPLNFVNNFSDVNKELLVEMKDEMSKGNFSDANEIANDVIANEEKINFHGKRADAIVKGMLQHSRSSSGNKEPTDINALCDEYLRLSYHGLRAKDKSFNAALETDFDNSIGNINIIPQDIGRVVMNLLTNAFYAVNEKKRSAVAKPTEVKYEQTVSISTKKTGNYVEIKVSDNGNGIPQKVLDKIFQPFFTTKPTGQGTGLGLSLSYDIVKAHNGEIKVETKENKGTTFKIILPIS